MSERWKPSEGRRAAIARLVAALALGLGVATSFLAWGGTLRFVGGDLVVAGAAVLAALVGWAAASMHALRPAVMRAFRASLLVGGLMGLGAVGAPTGPIATWFPLVGVAIWIGAAALRTALASPLLALLHRGAVLGTRDALDRTFPAAAWWLLPAVTEAMLVVELMPHAFTGLAGPAMGVALALASAGTLVAGVLGCVQGLRGLGRLRAVDRESAWRTVPTASWDRPVPPEPWFFDDRPLDTVLVFRAATERRAYRGGDPEEARSLLPRDLGRVRRRLWLRAAASLVALGALLGVHATLGAGLRW